MSVKLGDFIELQTWKEDDLGENILLHTFEDGKHTPFQDWTIHMGKGGKPRLLNATTRISKETARALASELLKLADELENKNSDQETQSE